MPVDTRFKRYAHILAPAPRYPIWSVKTISLVATVVIAIVAALTLIIGQANIFHRLEWTLAICGICLFIFLTAGLYIGARVKREDLPSGKWAIQGDASDHVGHGADCIGDLGVDGADSPLGCLLSFLLWIVIALFAGVIVWATIQLGGAIVAAFFFALCWTMYRALRVVFARSRQCRGNLWPSLGWAGYYTVLYSGWILGVLLLGKWIAG